MHPFPNLQFQHYKEMKRSSAKTYESLKTFSLEHYQHYMSQDFGAVANLAKYSQVDRQSVIGLN